MLGASPQGSSCPVHDLAKDGLKLAAGARLIIAGNACHELFGLMMGDQVDGGTTETAARQTRAEAPGLGAGEVHEEIQLGNAVLQKVTGAFVALKHVLAKLAMIVLP